MASPGLWLASAYHILHRAGSEGHGPDERHRKALQPTQFPRFSQKLAWQLAAAFDRTCNGGYGMKWTQWCIVVVQRSGTVSE